MWLDGGVYHYCTRSQVVSARKAFLFSYVFFLQSLVAHTYIDVQGHSFTYTTCIFSCSTFNVCNVDGMYFKIQNVRVTQ